MSRASIPIKRRVLPAHTPVRLARAGYALQVALLLSAPVPSLADDLTGRPHASGPLLTSPRASSTPQARTAPLDPRLPTGPLFELYQRPATHTFLCSPLYPVCVHAESSTDRAAVQTILGALERNYRTLLVSGLPTPLLDIDLGGTPGFDVYLSSSASPLQVLADPPLLSSDRASGFCKISPRTPELDALLAQCLNESASFALDAAEGAASRRAYASAARIATQGLSNSDLAAIDDLQANPQLSLLSRDVWGQGERPPLADSALLLFGVLEHERRLEQPGAIAATMLTLSRREGPSFGLRYDNEPDLFDVLRHTVGDKPSDVADWLGRFALARALSSTSAANSQAFSLLRLAGPMARVRYDWVLPFSSLPRRVATVRPLEPLGATYLWLALDDVPLGATLGFRAEWEAPVAFKWMMAALDSDGRELARLDIPYLETATSVERSWVNFEAASAIVIVGLNLGAVDAAHPFDPDYQPWETHGCTVYLARL